MNYFAWYGTVLGNDGHTLGHTVNGQVVRASARIPLGRWLWLAESRRSWRNMTMKETVECVGEYYRWTHPEIDWEHYDWEQYSKKQKEKYH